MSDSAKSLVNQKFLFMMVGLPASGKSTYADRHIAGGTDVVVASSDAFIETQAKLERSTYNAVFKKYVDLAGEYCAKVALIGIRSGYDVIWDQTNLSKKVRAKRLALFPDTYYKVAKVVICKDRNTLGFRLSSRPGKNIPAGILKTMEESFEMPTLEEGFDRIDIIET